MVSVLCNFILREEKIGKKEHMRKKMSRLFPKLLKNINLQIQAAQYEENYTWAHLHQILVNIKRKAVRRNTTPLQTGKLIQITADFSSEQ